MDPSSSRGSSSPHSNLLRSVAKLFRFRRTSTKFKDGSSIFTQSELDQERNTKKHLITREAMESLLAQVFASISAVKATYVQLQIAQSPYDPDTIQSSDRAMVAELKHLSHLKHSYPQSHQFSHESLIFAEIQEQRNVINMFQITLKNLESILDRKDRELTSLRDTLLESEEQNKLLESKLHPKSSIFTLDKLHLSGLDPTHFIRALRSAVSSVRTFVEYLVLNMQSSGIPPPESILVESHVCSHMFSDFDRHHFGLRELGTSQPFDRQRFFNEFMRFKALSLKELLDGQSERELLFQSFCRAKFQTLPRSDTEEALYRDLDYWSLPNTAFFVGFAEMARRVWLLHLLFFSFEPEAKASIFVVPRGCRYSEVYMESTVNGGGRAAAPASRTVGFTVVPGFKVRKTVIQCRVYLEGGDGRL